MDVNTPAPSRLLKALATTAKWTLWLLLAAWTLFWASWGALHWLIVPRIDQLRPQLESRASQLLGVTVRVGAIAAESTGMIPSFALTQVRLLDAQGREALVLPRVLVALSPRSVLGLGFEQLYIDRPQLSVRRSREGKVYVAGLELSGTDQSDSPALDWFFSQPEFAIRHGTVLWTDELRDAPPLALEQVDLVVRNRARTHSLRVDATPPAEWGERIGLMAVLRQPLLTRSHGRWREWDGQVHAVLNRIDISQLRRYADLGVELARGQGALRAWADIRHGGVDAVTADVALTETVATLGPELQPLRLRSVTGRLGARLRPDGFEFSTEALQFDTQDGLHWPGGNVKLSYTGTVAGPGSKGPGGEITADRLDLAALSQIANRLPLGASAHAALTKYAPKGLVERISAKWQGPPEALTRLEAQGRVSQLEIAADLAPSLPGTVVAARLPGIRGAALDFDLNLNGGKATLAVDKGALLLPGVFEDPLIPLDQATADLQWRVDGTNLSAQVSRARFSNADAQGEFQAKWQTSDPDRSRGKSRFPGVLDLQGSLSRGEGTRVHRYLPLILHKPVRDYVRDAVVKGTIASLKFKVKGDLHDMPFTDPKLGEFNIAADARDVSFAFVPRSVQPRDALPWPVLTQLNGELVIDRTSLQIRNAQGMLGSLQVPRADALIADLLKKSAVAVNAEARGPLADMLGTLNNTPLSTITDQVLAKASASGAAELRLKLNLPLAGIDKSTVQGSVVLNGNDFQLAPDTPRLGRARGTVTFTETGFALAGVQARLLGGDVRLDGGSVPAAPGVTGARSMPSVVLRAQGAITADALRQARELGLLARLAQRASGTTSYAATLDFRRGHPEILFSSNLTGLALDLPAPFNKAADAALPLRVETALQRESLQPGPAGQVRLRDQIRLDVGRLASATFVRDISAQEPRVLRGAIGVGLTGDESAPLPDEGVVANVNLNRLDVDAWSEVMTQASGSALNASAPASQYMPASLAVRAREFQMGGRHLSNLVVGGTRLGSTWRANMEAQEFNGYVEYRQPVGANAGRVFARLARLTLAAGSASDVEVFLDEQPASIPALDIVVDELELRGKKLGRVEVEAVNRAAGAAGSVREWRLNKLNMTVPEATLTASGNWVSVNAQSEPATAGRTGAARAVGERRRTVMNFKLDILDAGEFLNRMGMKDVIRRGKGKMEGQVAWVGSPITLDYPSMTGAFSVNVESGQFLKADPGIAKLLGVLSLQSLPRRLTLDFRDVFSEGFAFDFIRGDVGIDAGIASTNNLQMKGVNAAVLMDGRADIGRETQNLRVVVVPEINAGTASLIATAINPAVGLGTFLAQFFLRRPLMDAATQEFHIDGTWLDPKIAKVERKAAAPATANGERTGRAEVDGAGSPAR